MSERKRKKKRNAYIGSWQESPFEKLAFPFTVENLKIVLARGSDETSDYTHQQIADWCIRFWLERDEGSLSSVNDSRLDIASEVVLDVDAQWDLYLVNEYSFEELKKMDFSKVVLPREWFNDWLNHLAQNDI